MLIGELSEKTGFSRDTIRYYEKEGLIAVGRKERRENNYKEYSAETLKRLLTIKIIKGFGFTLNETAEFLELLEANRATCDNVAEKALKKIELINTKIKELEELKTLVSMSIASCKTCCIDASISQNCDLLVVK